MRWVATPAMILLSVFLMITGYLILTAPNCTTVVECDDPVVRHAAVLFILGTLTGLSSGIFSTTHKARR